MFHCSNLLSKIWGAKKVNTSPSPPAPSWAEGFPQGRSLARSPQDLGPGIHALSDFWVHISSHQLGVSHPKSSQ